jgi:hypothetical protein
MLQQLPWDQNSIEPGPSQIRGQQYSIQAELMTRIGYLGLLGLRLTHSYAAMFYTQQNSFLTQIMLC